MHLPLMTIRGWLIAGSVVTGALAIVMTSVSFQIDRALDRSSGSFSLELDYLIVCAVVVMPVLLLLRIWTSPSNP